MPISLAGIDIESPRSLILKNVSSGNVIVGDLKISLRPNHSVDLYSIQSATKRRWKSPNQVFDSNDLKLLLMGGFVTLNDTLGEESLDTVTDASLLDISSEIFPSELNLGEVSFDVEDLTLSAVTNDLKVEFPIPIAQTQKIVATQDHVDEGFDVTVGDEYSLLYKITIINWEGSPNKNGIYYIAVSDLGTNPTSTVVSTAVAPHNVTPLELTVNYIILDTTHGGSAGQFADPYSAHNVRYIEGVGSSSSFVAAYEDAGIAIKKGLFLVDGNVFLSSGTKVYMLTVTNSATI